MPGTIFKIYRLALAFILISQLILSPLLSYGDTHLRPLAAKVSQSTSTEPYPLMKINQGPGPTESRVNIPQDPPLKMVKLFGDGTSPVKIVRGNAAIFGPYSAEELMHSILVGELTAENNRIKRLVKAIINDVKIRYSDDMDFCRRLARRLVAYRKQVRNYFYERCKLAEKEKGVLIKDGISMLEFLLSTDLQKEHGLDNKEEVELLTIILDRVKEYLIHNRPLVTRLRDPKNPTDEEKGVIRQRAEQEWQRLLKVQEETKKLYNGLIKQLSSKIERLTNNIRGFEINIDNLTVSLTSSNDTDEATVIKGRIEDAKTTIKKMQEDIEKSGIAILLYKVYLAVIEGLPFDLQGKESSVPERLMKENRSIADILYNDFYKGLEMERSRIDRSTAQSTENVLGDERYAKMTESMRIIEDIIGHILEIDPFYLKGPAEEESIILFTDTEIGVATLFNLLSRYRIKGIASLEGTPGSHWIIIASQMGIPVVILKGLRKRRESVMEYVSAGNEVILRTQQKEGESYVVINPDTPTNIKYEIDKTEAEEYHQLCLSQVLSGATRQKGIPIEIDGNVSSAEGIGDVFKEGGNKIGLLRTEIFLERCAPIFKKYIQNSCITDDGIYRSAYKDLLLAQIRRDVLRYLKPCKDRQGQVVVTIRTFDITEDKNENILVEIPKEQRKEGFELYRKEIGKNILILQMAAILQATYIANRKGYNVRPVIIFPRVKNEDDLRWISHKIFPCALKETLSWLASQTQQRQTTPLSSQDAISLVKFQEAIDERLTKMEGKSYAGAMLNLAILEDIIKQDRIIAEGQESQILNRAVLNSFVDVAKGIVYGSMVETADIIDNINAVVATPDFTILSVGTTGLTEEIVAKEFKALGVSVDVSRDDEYFEKFFFELTPCVLKAIIRVAEKVSRWNKEHPDNIKRLGFCGELASREKFVLFALWLKDKYDIPIYLSMPAGCMPIMEYFRSFVKKKDLSIFDGEIGFKIEPTAIKNVDTIYTLIRQSEEYKREVLREIKDTESLIERLLLDVKTQPANPQDPVVLTAISKAA